MIILFLDCCFGAGVDYVVDILVVVDWCCGDGVV